jgi:hypothetical protein
MPDGRVFEKGAFGAGGNLTGQYLTARDNDEWAMFLLFWTWCEKPGRTVEGLLKKISLAKNADDISWTQNDPLDPEFNPELFAWVIYRDFGVTITSNDWGMIDWHKLSILSFKLEWDMSYRMFFHSPDTERILCSLQWPRGTVAESRTKTLSRINNIRVATWGNHELRRIIAALFWRYYDTFKDSLKYDRDWLTVARSYHTDHALGVLYSGEERKQILTPQCVRKRREQIQRRLNAELKTAHFFATHEAADLLPHFTRDDGTIQPMANNDQEYATYRVHQIIYAESTEIIIDRYAAENPDYLFIVRAEGSDGFAPITAVVKDLTEDDADWWRNCKDIVRFLFWTALVFLMLGAPAWAEPLQQRPVSELWFLVDLQPTNSTFPLSFMPKATPGRVVAELAHSALTKPIEGLLDIFSETLSDQFAKAVALPKMGKSKKKSSRKGSKKGSKKKTSKKASAKKSSRKASVKQAASAIAKAVKQTRKRNKRKGPKGGGRPAGTRAKKGFSMDYANFKGKDYVTTLQFSNVSGGAQQILEGPGQVIYKTQLRPWLMVQNGRLARCMALFEKWRPKSLKFEFRSTMPRGANAGTVLVVYDPKVDPNEFPDVTLGEEAEDRKTLSRFEAHTNAKILEVDPAKGKLNEFTVNIGLNTGPFGGWFYFDKLGETEAMFNQSFGQLMVMVQGPMNCLGSNGEYPNADEKPQIDWADLIIHYEIECSVAAEQESDDVTDTVYSVQGNWSNSNPTSYNSWLNNLGASQQYNFLELFTNPFFGIFSGSVDELGTVLVGAEDDQPYMRINAKSKQGLLALLMATPVHADIGANVASGWLNPSCTTYNGTHVDGYAEHLPAVRAHGYLPTVLFFCPADTGAIRYYILPSVWTPGTGGTDTPSDDVYYDFFAFEIPSSWNIARDKPDPEFFKDPKIMKALMQLLQERGVSIPSLKAAAEPKRLEAPKKMRGETKIEPKEYVIVPAPDSADEKKRTKLCSDCLEDRACKREPPCPMATVAEPLLKPALKRVQLAEEPKPKPTRSASNKT